jgi:hypothetical protein
LEQNQPFHRLFSVVSWGKGNRIINNFGAGDGNRTHVRSLGTRRHRSDIILGKYALGLEIDRIIFSMGQTNTNVTAHSCSRCHNRRPIHDFPYPREVWWCSGCWHLHRKNQNEQKRRKRQAALKQYLFGPRPPRSWQYARYKSKGGLAALSPLERYQAQTEYNKLIENCMHGGVPISQKKSASLWANAIFIVKNVRTGKMRSWVSNNRKRWKQWERLQEQQKLEEFKSKPLCTRSKVLPCF